MRVGLDTSPLVQTQAGTARYIRALLAHNEYERLSWGGRTRPATIVRDAWWYPHGLPREARGLDVLHCPTFRGPVRSRVPMVVTVHDLAVLRHPETFNQWTRRYSRFVVPRVARAARRVIAVSEFTRGEIVELLGVPAERIDVIPNAVGPPFVADGPAAEGDYVLAVGTLEPRKNLAAAQQAARRLGAPAAGRRERVAGAMSRSMGGWAASPTTSSPRSTAARAASSTRRCTRASASRCWRRWRAARRSSRAPGGATEEVAGGAAVLVDPRDPAAIAAGIEEADGAARRAASPRVSSGRQQFTWERVAAETRGRVRAGSRMTPAARRDRRGRARPAAHRGRDLRREPAAALPEARRRRLPLRGDHATPGTRTRRCGADRAPPARRSCGWPGRCRGCSAGCGRRSRTSSTRCRSDARVRRS